MAMLAVEAGPFFSQVVSLFIVVVVQFVLS